MKKNGKKRVKVCIACQCGIKVCGNSIDMAQYNLEIHRKSELHKSQMEGNKIIKEGAKE